MSNAAAGGGVAAPDDACWQHRFAEVNGVRLHYVEAGAGPLVVLLHGFPELWYSWRRQIPALAAAGFRVIAPDLRGYNLSEKPAGIEAYGAARVVDDVRALIESTGARRASVVGHDIGAGVAWALAMRHPGSVERIAILNGPHPVRMMVGLLHPMQLARSWYMFFFQLPALPELLARRNGCAMLLAPLEHIPAAAHWASHEHDAYRRAFEAPGAVHAMINYYRAMLRASRGVRLQRVDAPVLVLWGDRDPYLRRSLAAPARRWAPNMRVEHLPEAGHFIQHEQPGLINNRLIAFLNEGRVEARTALAS
jgi:epoxide hydrolase 4